MKPSHILILLLILILTTNTTGCASNSVRTEVVNIAGSKNINSNSTNSKNINSDSTNSVCVYIKDLTKLYEPYTKFVKEAEYSGEVGYKGTSLGGEYKTLSEFYMLQEIMNQQALTINNTLRAIVTMNNHSCSEKNIERSWEAIARRVEIVGGVLDYGTKGG